MNFAASLLHQLGVWRKFQQNAKNSTGIRVPRAIKCFLTSVVLFHRILTAWLINTTFFSLFIYLFFSESRGVTSRELSSQSPPTPPPSDAAYLHQDVEGAGAGAVGAGEEIVEVDAVGVVLLHDRQLEAGLLADVVLGDVHVHVGTYGRGREVRKTPGRHSWLNVHLLKFSPFWKTSNDGRAQMVSGAARLVSSINRAVGFASAVWHLISSPARGWERRFV